MPRHTTKQDQPPPLDSQPSCGLDVYMRVLRHRVKISIEKSDAFLGPKITFGENAKTLVNYGEFSESAGSSPKSKKRH